MNKHNMKLPGILLIIAVVITPITVAGDDTKIINDKQSTTLELMNQINNKDDSFPRWLQKAKLTASDAAFHDAFGNAVSISGDYAFIGSPNDDTYTGSVYVFKRTNGVWTQETKLHASDAAPFSWFGSSISVYEQYALIGTAWNNDGIGSVYVFKYDGTTWTEQSKLTPSDGEPNDAFGLAVSLYDNYALIGAPYENNQNGSVYVFKRDGTTWTEETKLSLFLPNSGHGATFGHAVSLSGDYALIGAPLDEYSIGSAHIFKRTGSTWVEEATLTPSDGDTYDWFGSALSIHGDDALIGASNHGFGSAYAFKRSGTNWTEEEKLLADDGEEGDGFGGSISLSDNYAVLGAPSKDNGEGAAYVFKRIGTTWRQDGKLTASNGLPLVMFGYSVSINGNTVLVGAPDEYWGKGSAYVFNTFTPPSHFAYPSE